MLEVEDLTLAFYDRQKEGETVVRQISFSLDKGEVMGLVGESGCGKSMTALALMGLLPEHARWLSGKIVFDGRDLSALSAREMEALRGSRLAMIFQEPLTALNPTMRIGKQVEEVLALHTEMGRKAQREKVLEVLEQAGLKNPRQIFDAYPHQLSGGMRQRVMIAMAVALEPALLVADEPTTALDVTTERQILELLTRISREKNMGILLITHDLKLAGKYCRRVAVMEKGSIVEKGGAREVFGNPSHAYTQKLVSAVLVSHPENRLCGLSDAHRRKKALRHGDENQNANLLEVESLNVFYREKRKRVQALWDIRMEIRKNEIVGLVGESGCGKSTLARALVGLNREYTGEIRRFGGRPQMIFQDPYSSLNPFYTIGRLLEEPLFLRGERDGEKRRGKVLEMLGKVGLDEGVYGRRPRELSGGQRQRVSIGMALLGEPSFIVADEPVSALDVTVRSQIMELLLSLQEEMGNSYLFISHDMDVIYHMCDRILVMREGRIVEEGPVEKVFEAPENEYTKILLNF